MLTLTEALRAWRPGSGAANADPVALLAAVWSEIVGASNAAKSAPSKIVGDVLVVTTAAGVWSQSLSLLQEPILAAIAARVPQPPVRALRFRVGALPRARAAPASRAGVAEARGPSPVRPPSATADAALARWRASVEAQRRAKLLAGWNLCDRCEALVAPGTACATCARTQAEARATATARVLFEAPWLGFAGTARLIEGLTLDEYAATRRALLARWWGELKAAARAKHISRGGRERSIAASYVVLESGLNPDRISPATVRNALGDEIYQLLYGTERS